MNDTVDPERDYLQQTLAEVEGATLGYLTELDDGRTKVDFTLGIEHVWMWLTMIGMFMVLGMLIALFAKDGVSCSGGVSVTDRGVVMLWMLVGLLAATALSGLLWRRADNCYFIDPKRECVLYQRRILMSPTLRKEATFDDIAAVIVDGKKETRREGSNWDSWIALVLKDARTIRFSDPIGTYDYAQIPTFNRFAERLGKLLEVPVHPGSAFRSWQIHQLRGRNVHIEPIERVHRSPKS